MSKAMVAALRSLFDDGQLVRLWGVPVEEVARRIEGAYLAERGKEEAFGEEAPVRVRYHHSPIEKSMGRVTAIDVSEKGVSITWEET